MTNPTILITDTLFIGRKHERMLTQAGYSIKRLTQPRATEAELCAAVPGTVGYILGGLEQVTSKVLDAGDTLKGIVFTGIDYKPFIPAWEYAGKRGITIETTPDGPTQAVAEWAMAAALLMNRRLLELGKTGELKNITTPGLWEQKIGIVGYGRVGQRIAELMAPFRPASISYYSRHKQKSTGLDQPKYQPLSTLLAESDVVFLCIPEPDNLGFFDKSKLSAIKSDSLLVSSSHRGVINDDHLLEAVSAGKLRAAVDYTPDERFASLPLSHWFCSNQMSAFNTTAEQDSVSTTAVNKILNLLS